MITEIHIIEQFQKLHLTNIMRLISSLFNTNIFIIILLVLYICKILNMKDILFIIIGYLICLLIKLIIKRQRPFVVNNTIKNYSNEEYTNLIDIYSFPSGHTFIATLLCLILLKKYPNKNIFYIFIILVGMSRIFLGVHYPTDVIGGSILGYLYYLVIKNKL